jgi:hypothetical protein
MTAFKRTIDGEVALVERAEPDFVIAFAVTHEITSLLLQQSDDLFVEAARHYTEIVS